MLTAAEPGLLGSRYTVVRPLGAGGMGRVFEAENALTGKRAAVKQLHTRVARASEDELRKIVREARAMARIRHRNVVDVYDVLVEPDGIFLVMELLEGETLAARIERAPLPMATLVDYLCAAMRGVAAGHDVSVIHRDIKPENVFLARYPDEPQPVPIVLDFGISKLVDGVDGDTESGMVMGTPRYASFEQLRGAKQVDGRTDVYAFGVILYESFAGVPPYAAARSFAEQAIALATLAPTPLCVLRPDLPAGLVALVQQCIEREPESRPKSLRDLAAALESYGASGPQRLSGDVVTPRFRDQAAGLLCGAATAPSPSQPSRSVLASLGAAGQDPPLAASGTGSPSVRRVWPRRGALTGLLMAVVVSAAWLGRGAPSSESSPSAGNDPEARDRLGSGVATPPVTQPAAMVPLQTRATDPTEAAAVMAGPVPNAAPETAVSPVEPTRRSAGRVSSPERIHRPSERGSATRALNDAPAPGLLADASVDEPPDPRPTPPRAGPILRSDFH